MLLIVARYRLGQGQAYTVNSPFADRLDSSDLLFGEGCVQGLGKGFPGVFCNPNLWCTLGPNPNPDCSFSCSRKRSTREHPAMNMRVSNLVFRPDKS